MGRSGGRGRTYNLQIQSLLRRQLRHSRVHLVGVEPTTFGLRDRCSNQLSYRCVHPVGLEPTPFSLKGCHASITPEVRASGGSRTRMSDQDAEV